MAAILHFGSGVHFHCPCLKSVITDAKSSLAFSFYPPVLFHFIFIVQSLKPQPHSPSPLPFPCSAWSEVGRQQDFLPRFPSAPTCSLGKERREVKRLAEGFWSQDRWLCVFGSHGVSSVLGLGEECL